jgi:hypothetical protein
MCNACVYQNRRQYANGRILQQCGAVPSASPLAKISDRVFDCNQYRNASQPSLHEMKDIAWLFVSDERGVLGFTPQGKR